MSCKHNGLIIGQSCDITGSDNICNNCAAQITLLHAPAIYNGHVDNGGVRAANFTLTPPIKCPACGRELRKLDDWCANAYYMVPQLAEVEREG